MSHILSHTTSSERFPTSNPDDALCDIWKKHLPIDWRNSVDQPLYMKHFSEYEIAAQRCVGYDADERPCFTAHQLTLTRLSSDDDEEFYETVTYSEELAAWRLRDDRWLMFRMSSANQCNPSLGLYAILPDMPR
ncbi:hypothetical protein [Azonexus sp. IMCC34839]|uniref:hypothetical protein n=1 Tax=Azonexus sp. IMCC34839 TaxID=3133695 RepID=UPI00399BC849